MEKKTKKEQKEIPFIFICVGFSQSVGILESHFLTHTLTPGTVLVSHRAHVEQGSTVRLVALMLDCMVSVPASELWYCSLQAAIDDWQLSVTIPVKLY